LAGQQPRNNKWDGLLDTEEDEAPPPTTPPTPATIASRTRSTTRTPAAKWNPCAPIGRTDPATASLMPTLPLITSRPSARLPSSTACACPDVEGQPFMPTPAVSGFREIVAGSWLVGPGHSAVAARVFPAHPEEERQTTGGAALMVVRWLMNHRPRAESVRGPRTR